MNFYNESMLERCFHIVQQILGFFYIVQVHVCANGLETLRITLSRTPTQGTGHGPGRKFFFTIWQNSHNNFCGGENSKT